jgi:hypothetical protein
MANSRKSIPAQRKAVPARQGEPRSLAISERGIRTGGDFASLMSALMSDIIGGRVTPQVGNAACNAGGKLLKIVEMQYQYGKQRGVNGDRELSLVPGPQLREVA